MRHLQSIRFLATGVLLSVAAVAAHAQYTYPAFSSGGQISSYQQQYDSGDTFETYSPAIASDSSGKLWMAYFSSTHLLTIASSTDGATFNVQPVSGNYYLMNSAPTWALINGTLYLAFMDTSENVEIHSLNSSTGVLTYQTTVYSGNTGAYARRPAIAQFVGSNSIYVAWMAKTYDPGSGSQTGHWTDVALGTVNPTTGTLAFSTPVYTQAPVSMSYAAGSGPALTYYLGSMYLTYLDAATGYPQMFGVSSSTSTSFADLTGAGGGNGHYAGDPATAASQGTLMAMFRSDFPEDNLWAVGTFNGSTFGPSYMYGQTMKDSPSLAVNPSGTLYQAEFTNFPTSGNYDWLYWATSNTINPFPQDTGGGGGDPIGGCTRHLCNQDQ